MRLPLPPDLRRLRGPNWAPVSADKLVAAAVSSLPFSLTNAQKRALEEVLRDMRLVSSSTMYRYVLGICSGSRHDVENPTFDAASITWSRLCNLF